MNKYRINQLINLVMIAMLCLGISATSLGQSMALAAEEFEVQNDPGIQMLEIGPTAPTLYVGETVTVDLVASDMVDLYGAALELTFDPSIVEVVDDDPGTPGVQITPGTCPFPNFVVQNTADNTAGTINYDVASLAPSPPCNGTGVVASITFRALAVGMSPVHYNEWLLSDTNGEVIPSPAIDGSIEVIPPPTDTELRIDPPSATIPVSGTVTVDIVVADVADLYGVALELTFDPAVVEVVDDDPGTPGVQIDPGTCPAPNFVVQNIADNSAGTINYDVASLAPSPACNGTGVVASITFHGIFGPDTSPVHFNSWLLSDTNGVPIPAATQDGSITVVDGGPTLLWIDPPVATIPVSGTVTVDIVIDNVNDLYGVALELTFDPARVEVVDDDPGQPGVQIDPGTCPAPNFVVQNIANNSAGTINYDVASLAPSPPCNGTGEVASITFHRIGPGTSPVHFNSWLLSDTNGVPIPVATQDGSIEGHVDVAQLWIDPPWDTVPVSGTVTLDIAIDNVNDLYGIQLELSFDPTKVEVVDADLGSPGIQITPGSCPQPDFVVRNEADNSVGTIIYAVTSLNPTPACNGSGDVASVEFHGLGEVEDTPIHFNDWLMSDTDGFSIPATAQDGALDVIPGGTIIGTVLLQGRTDRSGAAVTAESGSTIVDSTVTNADGSYELAVPAGTYLVRVEMALYLDAEKTGVVVTEGSVITLATVELLGGDSNDDDLVNVQDLAIIGSHFLFVCGDPGWDNRADINVDCVVNILDLSLAGVNFHLTSPVPWA